MKTNIPTHPVLRAFALLAFVGALSASSFAQTTYTWTGSTDGSWSDQTNWDPATGVPGGTATDIAAFDADGLNQNVTLGSDTTIGQLSFTGGTYAFSGAALTVSRATSNTSNLFVNVASGADVTFNSTLILTGTTTSANTRYISVGSGGTLTLTAGLAAAKDGSATDTNLNFSGGGTINLSGTITTVNSFNVSGSGTVLNTNYNGARPYTYTATSGGRINLLSATSATISVSGDASAIYFQHSGSANGGSNMLRLAPSANGTVTLGADISGGGTATYTQTVQLNYSATVANATMRLDATSGSTLNLSGVVKDTNAAGTGTKVQITGAGIVRYSGTAANTSVTPIVIDTGATLVLAKTAGIDAIAGGSVTVNTGGQLQLAASNQINDAATFAFAGGTFNAGAFTEALGALTVGSDGGTIDFGGSAGSLTFASLSSIVGTLTITGWTPDASITFTDGSAWDSTALSHVVFAGYGAAEFDSITHQLTAAAIPEPAATAGVAALAVLSLGLLARRRRSVAR